MRTCIICHFTTELDDVVIERGSTGCICLGCYLRTTGTGRPMPKTLRRQITATLDGLAVP